MISIPIASVLLWLVAGVVWYYFLSGFIWGAGYAPTSRNEIEKVARLLKLEKGGVFYDLGSGNGRMLFEIAKRYGSKCVGVEVDPLKCLWSNFMIGRKKLRNEVIVIRSNFLQFNLHEAERVFVFLSSSTSVMEKLREKLQSEMKPGSLVVSYTHRFKNWRPEEVNGKLFLYSIPKGTKY